MHDTQLPHWLVVNADDLGFSREINRGVLYTFRRGIVRSASLSASAPEFEHAVQLLLREPVLDVGVHLTFFGTYPVLPTVRVRHLVNRRGMFEPTLLRAMGRLCLSSAVLEQLEAEFRAQIERVQSAGILISHLDCHGHLQVLPPVFHLVLRLAQTYGISWVRLPYEAQPRFSGGSIFRSAQLLAANVLCLFNRSSIHAIDPVLRHADHLLGIDVSGRLEERWLVRQLIALRSGVTELLCHPGFRDTGRYQRTQELSALTADSVKRAVAESGIVLTNFRQLSQYGSTLTRSIAAVGSSAIATPVSIGY